MYQIWLKYLVMTMRSMSLSFRLSFDNVTPINPLFRLLVTWWSPHGRGAYYRKISCWYFYVIGSYWHLSEITHGGRRHLRFLAEPSEHSRRHSHGPHSLYKIRHDRLSSFQVIRIWIFWRWGLKVLFTPPRFQFLRILAAKFSRTSFTPPKGTSLRI